MRELDRRERRMVRVLATVAYGACTGHLRHATKVGARRSMREHVEAHRAGALRCWKCRHGRRPNVFACFDWVQHWHWGHQ